MTASSQRAEDIRASLSHPVIDTDGHVLEFLPEVCEQIRSIAGSDVAQAFDAILRVSKTTRHLSADQKRALGLFRLSWWAFPARNTVDRATAMLPRLQYERLDELGLDFAILYPTYGLTPMSIDDEELRRASARGLNRYYAETYGEFRDRIATAAVIPMHTPEEAIEELDYAVGELGLRNVVLAGHVHRPIPIDNAPRTARWVDNFAVDSAYDYDPVWRKCLELGVVPTFHSSGMGWGNRSSLSSYMYNHLGNFSIAGESTCRSLFLGGVPKRFPELRFAFLEGGVAWACALYSDILGHFEKRGGDAILQFDPNEIDRSAFGELFDRYAPDSFAKHRDSLDAALSPLSDPTENRDGIDEFRLSGVTTPDEIKHIFSEQFFYGCEADDPLNALAFATDLNPLGARLRPIFGSDIGHWDVPDMRGVLAEAREGVDEGKITEEDFRDFVFANPVRMLTHGRPDYFAGTPVADAATALREA